MCSICEYVGLGSLDIQVRIIYHIGRENISLFYMEKVRDRCVCMCSMWVCGVDKVGYVGGYECVCMCVGGWKDYL